ncbi:hypothetical protein JCM1393_27330 [Clostridium carnis]
MLDLFVYLDETLVRNLDSMVLNGYIDIRTLRNITDKTLTGSVRLSARGASNEERKLINDENDGYKGKHTGCNNQQQNSNENNSQLEDRNFNRREEEIRTIKANFSFHQELLNNLKSSNEIREINDNNLNVSSLQVGEYIEVKGTINTLSIVTYLDILISIISSYNIDFLNGLRKKDDKLNLDFLSISNILTSLKNSLIKNGTQDLIMDIDENKKILMVINENNFLNNNAYMFDLAYCKCKVFGKIIKIMNNEKISLLRKCTIESYYEKMLKSLEPYFNLLNGENIPIPDKPNLYLEGEILLLLPISISI